MDWNFNFYDDLTVPFGAACGNGSVCPNASASECNQTDGFTNQSATWTTQVQVTMGGSVKA